MCGLCFTSQSGYEHRHLRANQLQPHEPNDKPAFIVYHETISKHNPGGLVDSVLKPKQVQHFTYFVDQLCTRNIEAFDLLVAL